MPRTLNAGGMPGVCLGLVFAAVAVSAEGFPLAAGQLRTTNSNAASGALSHGAVQAGRRPVHQLAPAELLRRHKRPLTMTGGGAKAPDESEKSSMTQASFNLVKNVLGAGMLSLPAGVAAFSDSRKAVLPATAIIAALGALSAYTFSLIGRTCSESNAETYEQSWARTVSQKSAWVPAAACVATCFAGCLAYTIIIGDSFAALLKTFGAPSYITRSKIIAFASLVVLLPLSLLKNLKALGFTSMLGSTGMVYTAVMMGIRYFDKSYAVGGRFCEVLAKSGAAPPVFGSKPASPLLLLVLVSMLGTAYEAHFNAPLFFRELKDNTVKRFNTMVGTSFAIAVVTMSAVASFGFLTFGGSSAGFILNNYANSDRLATVARIFVGLSIIFSYPLCFIGLRDGILELRGVNKPTEQTRNAWTVGLIALVSGLSMFLSDLGFVNSFGGALIASSIIYVFPAIMFLQPIRKKIQAGLLQLKQQKWLKLEYYGSWAIVGVGITMGLLGAIISVLETFTSVLG